MTATRILLIFAMISTVSTGAQAGWLDVLKGFMGGDESASITESVGSAALGRDDLVGGLKQALEKGVDIAVDELSKPDGFLGSDRVRIPVPDRLQPIESALRAAGQGKVVDAFVETLNRAAEAAVPETLAILKSTVKSMSFDDARGILDGPDDAATQYMRRVGGDRIREKVAPVVKRATDRSGVTASYKNLLANLGFMQRLLQPKDYDLDNYVTEQTMDGLYTMIAAEEKRIRENPLARSTELLKKVFSE